MTTEQYAKSHLAASTHVEGTVEFDLSAMPDYKMIPFLRALKKDVLRFKHERAGVTEANHENR